jgi:hypothetical protein
MSRADQGFIRLIRLADAVVCYQAGHDQDLLAVNVRCWQL